MSYCATLLAGLLLASLVEISRGHNSQYQIHVSNATSNTNATSQTSQINTTGYQYLGTQTQNRTNETPQVSTTLDEDDQDEQNDDTLLQQDGVLIMSSYRSQTTFNHETVKQFKTPPTHFRFGRSYFREPSHIAGGERLESYDDPLLRWHVGIYSKAFEPYLQICGGTLVTTKAVVSAAHCFWSDSEDGALPASRFAAAAGKIFRPWDNPREIHAQKTDISAVHLPARFRGAITSFQDDIAAVILATTYTITPMIRPICVNFDEDLEAERLQNGVGAIVGWGLTAEDGAPAQRLQYVYMPFVPIEECIASTQPTFLKYLTSDKICAGVTNGQALCRGDSGGGLVYFDHYNDEYVLYGVASTAPRNAHQCNTHARAALTRVLAHRAFLRTHIPDVECAKNGQLERALGAKDHENVQTQPVFNCNCSCNNLSTP